jgi:hypothetical protein
VGGEGIMLHYPRQALNRAGFSVIPGKDLPHVKVPSADSSTWQYEDRNCKMEFGSVYDFITWICGN